MTTTRPELSIDGVIAELQALAQISEAEPPVVTRVVFSEADLRARAYVKGLCADAGLTITEDAIGNTFARWEGSRAGPGSHRHRVAHRCDSRTPDCTTGAWACLAAWKRFAF